MNTNNNEKSNKITVSAMRASIGLLLLMSSSLLISAVAQESTKGREATTDNVLRVCADPANLPFSNKAKEGFENKIIEMIGKDLGVPVQYKWFPQSFGFVKNTLRLRTCDLISGISTTSSQVQNTNPYYKSVYSYVVREGSTWDNDALNVTLLGDAKVGLVARTPPASLLANHGLMRQVTPYQLTVDTRLGSPAKTAVQAVAAGDTDIALVWGPIAGYYVQENNSQTDSVTLRLIPMLNEDPEEKIRYIYSISMAMRYNENTWKHRINDILESREKDIVEILKGYGMPLLDRQGKLQ